MSARLLTVDDLCGRWRCGRDTIYAAIHKGELKAFYIGGWKIEQMEADRFQAATLHRPKPARRRPGPKPKVRHLRKVGVATKGV